MKPKARQGLWDASTQCINAGKVCLKVAFRLMGKVMRTSVKTDKMLRCLWLDPSGIFEMQIEVA